MSMSQSLQLRLDKQRRNVTNTKSCYGTVDENRILNEKILRSIVCFGNNEQSGLILRK
jgi:hypothetical protein